MALTTVRYVGLTVPAQRAKVPEGKASAQAAAAARA